MTRKIQTNPILVHSLEHDSTMINILPLDHTNPYDFKREHRHTYFEVMLIERGGCSQLIDFETYPGFDHSCYIICPQQIHLMNRNGSSGYVIQFTEDRIDSGELLPLLRQLAVSPNAAVIFENDAEKYKELHALLTTLSKQLKSSTTANNFAVTQLLQAFIAIVLVNKRQEDVNTMDSDRKSLLGFYALLETHYKHHGEVGFYVDKLRITNKKLSSLTKKHTGYNPLQLIHNRILLEAKRLLVFENIPHKEIAYSLGFDSPPSFSAFIKSKTGYSPSELGKRLSEIHK